MRYISQAFKAILIAVIAVILCMLPPAIAFIISQNVLIVFIFFGIGLTLMFAFIFWVADNISI